MSEGETLRGLKEELERCRASQRSYSDRLLQLEAESELLARQLGAAQDQQAPCSPRRPLLPSTPPPLLPPTPLDSRPLSSSSPHPPILPSPPVLSSLPLSFSVLRSPPILCLPLFPPPFHLCSILQPPFHPLFLSSRLPALLSPATPAFVYLFSLSTHLHTSSSSPPLLIFVESVSYGQLRLHR